MRETEKRIQLYRARLPKVKEKLIAAFLVFALSATTMAVATFSWLTLSIAPQSMGVATNIAANGSLEIALVGENGAEPAASAAGDALLSIQARNKTWGNLIDLSDSSYGLDKIVLRPASLNASKLLEQPLFAATYTADGRVEKLDADFNYTVYDSTTKNFVQASKLGVKNGIRAISSVVYETVQYENPSAKEYAERIDEVERQLYDVLTAFNGLSNQMDSIAGLIGTYMNSILRGTYGEEPCNPEDIYNFYVLLCDVDEKVMDPIGAAIMEIFSIYQDQTDMFKNSEGEVVEYTPAEFETLDEFCAGALTELAKMNSIRTASNVNQGAIVFSSLSQYIKDRTKLKSDINTLAPDAASYKAGVPVARNWKYIEPIANNMVQISSVTLNGYNMNWWFTGIGSKIPDLLGILNAKASENNVVITAGMLERLDKLLHNGSGFYVPEITIKFDKSALEEKAKDYIGNNTWLLAGVGNTVSANIRTDAVVELPTSTSVTDVAEANRISGTALSSVTYRAKETYGLSLDFWLRTNKTGSYLILEGDVISREDPVFETVQYVTRDANGDITATTEIEDAPIYITNIVYKTTVDYVDDSTEDTENEYTLYSQEIFKVVSGDTEAWYLKSDGEKIMLGDTVTQNKDGDTLVSTKTVNISFAQDDPPQKTNSVVTGYSGVNRVWLEDELANADLSTTQGSGSCYIFYADTPEEMEQSLELIAAMKVAFVDGESGKLLATAHFDKEKKFSEFGRVTVPLYLDNASDTISVQQSDGSSTDLRVITDLTRNDVRMISAIVYLDGAMVSNDSVLAASEIEGSLNIQFGSYTAPDAMSDDKLMADTRSITAELDGTYDYALGDGQEHIVKVKLNVSGATPTSITGNFIRIISQTQGTRQESFDFENKGDGVWEGTFEFKTPGEFVLRTVTVDGIEYLLNQTTLPKVTIDGFGLESVSGEKGLRYVYRTADNQVTESFDVVVAGLDGAWPTSVQGVFMGDNGTSITTSFTGSNANWAADISFTRSGTYTMSHIIIDGQHFPMAKPMVREVYTGLYSRVNISLADTYTEEETENGNPVSSSGIQYFYVGNPHEFDVSVEIFDDSGNEITGLGNVKLFYSNGLDADLTWNEKTGRYDGESFLVEGIGVFSFVHVSVSGEYIDKATGAATITSATKDPVKYLGIQNEIDTYVVNLNANATAEEITLVFENAKAASVYGLFKQTLNSDTVYYAVMLAENNDDSTHTFNIPAKNGYWELIDVKVMNVYDEATGIFYTGNPNSGWPTQTGYITITDKQASWYGLDDIMNEAGTAVEEDHYYNVDLDDVSNLTYKNTVAAVKVVNTVNVSDMSSQNKSFNGVFMESHTVSGFNVSFTDFEGQALDKDKGYEIKNVVLNFGHGGTTKYTAYDADGNAITLSESFILNMSPDSDGKVFTQSTDKVLVHEGTYNGHLEYDVVENGKIIKEDKISGATKITINLTVPEVKISAVSPSTQMNVDNASGSHTTETNEKKSTTEATVYIKCTTHSYYDWFTKKTAHCYQSSTVTITLSNSGYASKAKLDFKDTNDNVTTRLYKVWEDAFGRANYTSTALGYEWGGENTTLNGCDDNIYRYVGYSKYSSSSLDYRTGEKTSAGTIKATHLVMTYGGVNYIFDIPDITINNPY